MDSVLDHALDPALDSVADPVSDPETKSNNEIGLGVVGWGEHFQRSHLPFLPRPLACYDPSLSEAPLPGVALCESLESLLSHPGVTAVVITSPDRFHADQLEAAVKAGHHVLIDKPLALTDADLSKVADSLKLAQAQNLSVATCHPRRYDPPIVALKKRVNWCQVKHFVFRFHYHRAADPWKQTRSLLQDHLGHEVDLLHFLFGEEIPVAMRKVEDSHARYRVRGTVGSATFEFDGQRVLDEKLYLETVEWEGFDDIRHLLQLNNGLKLTADWNLEEQGPRKDYNVMFKAVNDVFLRSLPTSSKTSATEECHAPWQLYRNNLYGVRLGGSSNKTLTGVTQRAQTLFL
jgi:hypothetical protein